MTKPLLGVIGGMGTQATACFYEKLHNLQTVTVEQDYMDILLYSMPSIPDRTAFITGQSDNDPFIYLKHAAKTLETAGVSAIALPCATSHYFYNELSDTVDIPIINILDETAFYAKEQGYKNVCLLATSGTIKGRAFHSAFEKQNITVSIPSATTQFELMDLIYSIKRGESNSSETLESIMAIMPETIADAVILGCTELCVIAKESPRVVNILDVLAKASLKQVRQGTV